MQRLLGAIFGAAAAVAIALLIYTTINPPAVGSDADLVAAQRETERHLADELSALRHELERLRQVPIEERIIDLPEDGGRYYLTLVLEDRWQARGGHSAVVYSWFQSDSRLAALKAQCHFFAYTPDHRWFQRNAHLADRVPAVVLQRHDGFVVFKASGANLPPTARQLADAIADWCPRPRPTPPAPTPLPVPTPPVIPDTVVEPEPDEEAQPVEEPGLLYYLIPLLLGGAGGGLVTARKPRPF